MFDDITEFTRFYQTGTGQRVAGLIRQQLGSFWPSGSSSSVAFLGYAQPFIDKGSAALGMMPARRGAIAGYCAQPQRPMGKGGTDAIRSRSSLFWAPATPFDGNAWLYAAANPPRGLYATISRRACPAFCASCRACRCQMVACYGRRSACRG